jgi:uncharacterized protein
MVNGGDDRVVPADSAKNLVDKLKTQKGIVITHETIPGANHFFEDKVEDLMGVVNGYLDVRLDPNRRIAPAGKSKGSASSSG